MASETDKSAQQPWGDAVDGEDFDEQSSPSEEPVEIVVEIRKNQSGQTEKVTRTIQKVKIIDRVNKRAQQRRQNWKKFGEAMDKTYQQTTSIGDPVQFQYEKVGKTEKKTLEEQIKKEVQETMMKAGKPSVGAWTQRRLAAEQEAALQPGTMRAPGGARITATPGAYVPPGRARGDDMATIRVSNLADEATEPELYDLFGRYGQLLRVRPLMDKATGDFKNIAFVTFAEREAAERAMKQLEGVGLHHLIMHMEWAKPSISFGGPAEKSYRS